MVSYKQTFMMIIIFFSYVITFASADEAEELRKQCYDKMKKYCGINHFTSDQTPSAKICLKKAIEEWTTNKMNNIPPEDVVIKNYYESFKAKINLSELLDVKIFCEKWKKFMIIQTQCMADLEIFGNTKEDIVNAAIYLFTVEYFKDLDTKRKANAESSSDDSDDDNDNNYAQEEQRLELTYKDTRVKSFQKSHMGLMYIRKISNQLGFDKGIIEEPVDYCQKYVEDLLKEHPQ